MNIVCISLKPRTDCWRPSSETSGSTGESNRKDSTTAKLESRSCCPAKQYLCLTTRESPRRDLGMRMRRRRRDRRLRLNLLRAIYSRQENKFGMAACSPMHRSNNPAFPRRPLRGGSSGTAESDENIKKKPAKNKKYLVGIIMSAKKTQLAKLRIDRMGQSGSRRGESLAQSLEPVRRNWYQ